MAVHRILIVDDEPGMCRMLCRLLEREGYEVLSAESAETAMPIVASQNLSLIISDLQMPGLGGLGLLKQLSEFDPSIPVIVITAYGTVENAVEALRAGARDYLTKPFESDEIILTLRKVLERERLVEENRYLHEELEGRYGHQRLVGASTAIQEVLDLVRSAAPSRTSVLITGESGTGKELIARSIHQHSPRKDQPFVVLNCAALSEGVLESELFGHEKGAFSGALQTRKGRFELADGGTLFIDELAEMSPAAQVKLLRVLQEHEFERVGGNRTIRSDARIVAATNKNLEQEVRSGNFREDLYYRLNVINIHLPPLRERRSDIEALAGFFLQQYNRQAGKNISSLAPRTLQCLLAHDWPGNVRELQNVIERAVVLGRSETLTPRDLPPGMRGDLELCLQVPERGTSLTEILEELEQQIILQTLRREDGSQTRAADSLGIKRTTLRYKLEKYGLLDRV